MHESGLFPGTTWRVQLPQLYEVVPDVSRRYIVDFGCGPRGGLAEEFGANVICYDPFISEYCDSPWSKSFDVFFSSDVLEHMTRLQIDALLTQIRQKHPEVVFLNISTRQARKRLPNGANAHLTVRPAHWWFRKISNGLGRRYNVCLAKSDLLREDVTLCFKSLSGDE